MAAYANLDQSVTNIEPAALPQPRLLCHRPYRILGIQQNTPLSWSLDGLRLAFVSGSHTIYIATINGAGTDRESFSIEHLLVGHNLPVMSLQFHPTQPLLASCGREGIFVWNAQTGALVKNFGGLQHTDPLAHEGDVEALAWVHGGNYLVSGSKDTLIKVWDTNANFKCVESITGHKGSILHLKFHGGSCHLASAGRDSQIIVWDLSSLAGEALERRKDDGSIKCSQKQTLTGHRGDVTTLTWAKEGKILLSGARDNDIKIWDVEAGKEIRALKGHKGDIRELTLLNAEQLLFSASNDSFVKLWELGDIEVIGAEEALDLGDLGLDANILGDYGDGAVARGVAADAREVASGQRRDLAALLNGAVADKCILSVKAHDTTVAAMTINCALPYMATSSIDNTVRIWSIMDLLQPRCVAEFVGHGDSINACAMLQKDQYCLSASKDFKVFFYDVNSIQRITSFDFGGSISCMCVNQAQTLIFAGGSHYDVKAFSLDQSVQPHLKYKNVAVFRGHSGRVQAIAVSPAGDLLATGGHDFDILTWALSPTYPPLVDDAGQATPTIVKPNQTVGAHNGHVMHLKFSDDGAYLASVSTDHTLNVFRVNGTSVKKHFNVTAHSSVVSSVTWGSKTSANLIATGSWDMTIKVFDVTKNGTPECEFRAHKEKLTCVTSSTCGRFLVSASSDCTIRVWQFGGTFDCIATYETPLSEGPFFCVDGGENTFVSGSENGMLRVWPLPVESNLAAYFMEANTPAALAASAAVTGASNIDIKGKGKAPAPATGVGAGVAPSPRR